MSGPSRQAIDASYHPKGTISPAALANSQGPSPSLQRARKPFRFGNAIIGSTIALFAAGVYTYSISSVKQDDFSDVEDLLPPLAERSQLRSIEDEARAASAQKAAKSNAFQSVVSTLPSRPASGAAAPPTRPALVDVPVTGSFDSASKALPSSVGVADAELGIGASGSGVGGSAAVQARAGLREAGQAVEDAVSGRRGLGSYLPLPRRLDEVRWVRERGLVELGKGNVIVWGAPNVDNIGRVGDVAVRRNKGGPYV